MDLLKGIRARISRHNASIAAAGVAFYAMLALFPALIAVVAVYALVSDPYEVGRQISPVVRSLPSDIGKLLTDQLHDAVAANHGGLTVGLVASLLGVLWAASGGVNALTKGLRVATGPPPRSLSERRPAGVRQHRRWRFVTWGVGVALVVWVLGSVGFTVYVSNFGRYNKTYGSLAAVIVLQVWLYLSSFAILLGAVVDAELTARRARSAPAGKA